MKINHNTPNASTLIEKAKAESAQELLGGKTKTGNSGASEASPRSGATVEISDNARLMQKAMDVAKSAPDSRADKINQIKKSIRDGSYKVDSAKVADKLVDEHLGTDFGKNTL